MLWANIVKGYAPAKNCACKDDDPRPHRGLGTRTVYHPDG